MNEIYQNQSIKLIKYGNYRKINKNNKYEERTILRKWIKIKVDLIKII